MPSISGSQYMSYTNADSVAHAVTRTSFAHSPSVTGDKDSNLNPSDMPPSLYSQHQVGQGLPYGQAVSLGSQSHAWVDMTGFRGFIWGV